MTQHSQKRSINLLTEEVYNRIAAGEVVERPASVLKELIENALDADANEIDITVAGAGRTEICVSDNGVGMTKPDLMLAFERHATSKVSDVSDLNAINTLGFRGEALSAIASVARIEATSRRNNELSGFKIKIHAGKILNVNETGTPQGTTLAVRDLFYNTPARKKFLKSKGVESSHLVNTFKRFALAYPKIRWSYSNDGKNTYRLPPESSENRIQALFSDDIANHIFPVQAEDQTVRITGFLGSPKIARKSRGDQYIFVNKRWIQNRLLGYAIASGFGPLIEDRKFPFYVIFLDLPPEEIDVNVHPAKTEVKFRQEHEIFNILQNTVRQTLQKTSSVAFREVSLKTDEKLDPLTGEISTSKGATSGPYNQPVHPKRSNSIPFKPPSTIASPETYKLLFVPKNTEQTQSDLLSTSPDFDQGSRTNIYQFHNRYIVTEIKGSISLIDQHAAHERILYEKALQALQGKQTQSQQLLFPKMIEVAADEAMQLREVLSELQLLGIMIREFGERTFIIEALPSHLKQGTDDQIVSEMLDELRERGFTKNPGNEQIASAYACRAAIKFGQNLSLPEMNSLIDQLFATRYPFSCPHGRPTLINLTLSELERRFGRA